jgi:hypothetical protein
MLLFTKHKFVILSNRKCASTSLMHSLGEYADGTLFRDFRIRHTNYREYKNLIEPFLRHKIGDEVDEYDVYSLFREPTDWLHSWYRFRKRPAIAEAGTEKHKRYTGNVDWREFLRASVEETGESYAMATRQHQFVRGASKSEVGPTLVRYDDLNAFFEMILDRIGRKRSLDQRNVSPALNEGPSDDDRAYCRSHLARDYQLYDGIKPLA